MSTAKQNKNRYFSDQINWNSIKIWFNSSTFLSSNVLFFVHVFLLLSFSSSVSSFIWSINKFTKYQSIIKETTCWRINVQLSMSSNGSPCIVDTCLLQYLSNKYSAQLMLIWRIFVYLYYVGILFLILRFFFSLFIFVGKLDKVDLFM